MKEDNNIWDALILKQLSGEIQEDEQARLENWIQSDVMHKQRYTELAKTWELTSSLPELSASDVDLDKNWNAIQKGMQSGDSSNVDKPVRRIRYMRYAAAAVLAILVITWFYMSGELGNNRIQVVTAEVAGSQMVVLPDSSQVWLHDGASISYARGFEPRQLTLTGEAFFDVTRNPDNPFSVKTSNTLVEVLGTRFHLSTNDSGQVNLYVEEGRVAFAIEHSNQSPLILERDEAATADLSSSSVVYDQTYDRNEIAWLTGELNFDHLDINSVIYLLEKVYHIDLEVEDEAVLACTFKGDFSNVEMTEVLDAITFSLGLDYEMIDDRILLKGKGCSNLNSSEQ